MARLLAIDYGQKRTGIAVTDELQLIASGLTTLPTEKVVDFLKNYCTNENVEAIIIGLPKQMNNKVSESEVFIQSFIEKLQQNLPNLPIKRQDERFTSKIAMQSMIESGVKKKKRQEKERLDEISAVLILQSYMAMHTN
ncbi:MAG: Holliday junction resolvase RuvX [Capnocytophaga sp.]|nr:Holliday junction resolvase RuvX [Capnocytophaga sp.]